MKMTSSQLLTLIAAIVCSAAVVYAQTSPSTAAATDPPTEAATQPPATPTTGARPPVTTTQPPAEASTAAPPMDMSTAMPDAGTDATDAPMMMTTDDHDDNDTDGDDDDGDMDGEKDGHKEDDDKNDGGSGGLNDGQIALAVLATLLILGAIATFAGLCYWKYKGTSYVTVTSDTTYRQ